MGVATHDLEMDASRSRAPWREEGGETILLDGDLEAQVTQGCQPLYTAASQAAPADHRG